MLFPTHRITHGFVLFKLNMRKSNVTDDDLAALAYETYCKAVGGKAFNGDPLPSWTVLKELAVADPKKENICVAWKRAGRAVASLVEKTLPAPVLNPGDGVIVGAGPVKAYALTGVPSGRVAITSMPPSKRTLSKRTKCCGSISLSLVEGGKYRCPCKDTVLAPEEIT
jgi:hypothetical protein